MKNHDCKGCKYRKLGVFGHYCYKFNKWYEPLRTFNIMRCTIGRKKHETISRKWLS